MPQSLLVLFFVLLSSFGYSAKSHYSVPRPIPEYLPISDLEIELYTVGLGPEVYMRYGHTLLGFHFKSSGKRYIYNWGMFDFSDPLFPINFYLGKRTYWVGESELDGLLKLYKNYEDRNVFRDILNLTEHQKSKLVFETNQLLTDEKMFFQYEHFERNCSTIPRDLIDRAVGGALSKRLSKEPAEHSFRWYVRTHMGVLPYLGWLLDIAMNDKLDVPISKWEESFYPIKLRQHFSESPAFDDSGNSNGAAAFMIFDKELVQASSDWFDSDPNFYIFVSIFLLLCCLLSLFFQNFIFSLISSLLIGSVFGLIGLSMVVSWLFSSHFDMHHNTNMLAFFPTDLLLIFILRFGKKLWFKKYVLIHWIAFLIYLVIGFGGFSSQNISRVVPVALLYLVWISIVSQLVIYRNRKWTINL